MVGPGRPQLVLFGSSIVQFSYRHEGWGAALTDTYARQADVILRGYAGWNSRQALRVVDKIFPKDAGVQPALVIVYFGGNDSTLPDPTGQGPHVPLDEYVENMKKIAIHLQSLSEKTRLIFLSVPPINEEQMQQIPSDIVKTNEACKKYSDALLKLCENMKLTGIDLNSAIREIDDWLNVCFTDGVHFTSVASKKTVEEIIEVVKTADWEPSLYFEDMPTEFEDVSE